MWKVRGEVVRHVISGHGVYCEVWNWMRMHSRVKDQCVSPRHMRTAHIQKWDMTWQAAWTYVVCVGCVCVSVSVYLRVFALGPIYNSIISITLVKILPVKGLWTPGLASIGSLLKAQTKQKCAAINENISEYFEILIGFERIDVTINHYQSSDDMLTSIICIGLFQKN